MLHVVAATLDPIVSLSVALAESPGACAFLVGSGVSRDAGVLTGAEIVHDALRRLQQLENPKAEPLDGADLSAWLRSTGRDSLRYADVLELIAPDQATRRDYLASFFEGKRPGKTHEQLAQLAAQGMVRVFVTTNFDRLLEDALHAVGIQPIVISCDADLESAPAREHSRCTVIKPHGDYLQLTIRNTPDELAELDPGMTAALSEIFDRYGIVVLGYSGQDHAIAERLRARRTSYGLWWFSRGPLGEPASDLVAASGGRVVVRDSASAFLDDLQGRLTIFVQHPSGLTPDALHAETLALVRAKDEVGLDELLRRERYDYSIGVRDLHIASAQTMPASESLAEAWEKLLPVLERRLASLLVLGRHAPGRFREEVRALARQLETRGMVAGYKVWMGASEFAAGWLGYVCGAVLARLEQWEALAPLVAETWSDDGYVQPVVRLAGRFGDKLGETLAPKGSAWLSPTWEFVTRSATPLEWLRELYPELSDNDTFRGAMGQFDLVCCLGRADDYSSLAFFTLGGGGQDGAESLALRLHRDDRLRSTIAEVTTLPFDGFADAAREALKAAHVFSGGASRMGPGQIANLIEHGIWH
jgi:hypothetical protein